MQELFLNQRSASIYKLITICSIKVSGFAAFPLHTLQIFTLFKLQLDLKLVEQYAPALDALNFNAINISKEKTTKLEMEN